MTEPRDEARLRPTLPARLAPTLPGARPTLEPRWARPGPGSGAARAETTWAFDRRRISSMGDVGDMFAEVMGIEWPTKSKLVEVGEGDLLFPP